MAVKGFAGEEQSQTWVFIFQIQLMSCWQEGVLCSCLCRVSFFPGTKIVSGFPLGAGWFSSLPACAASAFSLWTKDCFGDKFCWSTSGRLFKETDWSCCSKNFLGDLGSHSAPPSDLLLGGMAMTVPSYWWRAVQGDNYVSIVLLLFEHFVQYCLRYFQLCGVWYCPL